MNSLWDIRIFLGLVPKESPCIKQPITVAARCKAWICSRLLAGTAASNPIWGMNICLVQVLRIFRYTSLRRADHSPIEFVLSVRMRACVCVWSWSLDNGETLPNTGTRKKEIHKEKKLKCLFKYVRGSFRMFPEPFYFWEIQKRTIISVTFPSK
jgi:hypothetical protein